MTGRLLPCLALACLAGCSVQMAYDHLDRLARWSVSDYVDFDDAQQAYFDARFDELWRWHRHDHLPRYADYLEALSLRLSDTDASHPGDAITEADIEQVSDRVTVWGGEIQDRALPVAADLLASLSDQQVGDLARAMENSNREIAEPEQGLSLERAQARWAHEFRDRFSRFSGRLDPVQRAYVDGQAAGYQPELVLWADYRRRWQADFLSLLAEAHGAAELQAALARLSQRRERERYYGPELTAVYEHNNALARRVSVWLINSLSERQRARFVQRLQDLAGTLRELAAEPGPLAEAPVPCLMRC